MPDRPPIICICGSARFIAEMAVLAWEAEKKGKIALGCHLLPHNYPNGKPHHQAEAEGVAEILDNLHREKVKLADEIIVCNKWGYVGEQTRKEILFAHELGKPIRWLEPDRIPEDLNFS